MSDVEAWLADRRRDVQEWLADGRRIGVMLRAVHYQLKDMRRVVEVAHPDALRYPGEHLERPDFCYLLRAAAAAASSGQVRVVGDEDFPIPQGVAYGTLADAHEHVLPRIGPQWMSACVEILLADLDRDLVEMLCHLERLEFAAGRLALFPILWEREVPERYRIKQEVDENKRAWGVVMPSWWLHVAARHPRWDMECLDYNLKEAEGTYVCAAAYAMLVHVKDGVPYVLVALHDQKGIYELPGGCVEHLADAGALEAASREWAEEVNPTDSWLFRLENAAMPAEGSDRVDHHVIATKDYLDEDKSPPWPGKAPRMLNRSRPCKAFVLMRASPDFYRSTRDGGEIQLPQEYCLGCQCRALHSPEPCECPPPRDPATLRRQFTEGLPYVECTKFKWLHWDRGAADREGDLQCSKASPAAIVRGALGRKEVRQFLGMPPEAAAGEAFMGAAAPSAPPLERTRIKLQPRSKAAAAADGGYTRDPSIFGAGRARGADQQ